MYITSEEPSFEPVNQQISTSNQTTVDRQRQQYIRGYARLLVHKGCSLSQGQELFVSAGIDVAPFVRIIAEEAYAAGCKRVTVDWHDETISRMTYDNCPVDEFRTMPEWRALLHNSMAHNGAAVLTIDSSNPEAMRGVDPAKMVAASMASHAACKEFYDCLDFGKTIWCIAGAASPAWAHKVFPDDPTEVAVDKLWDAILHTSRADCDDPLAAWELHDASFEARKKALNELDIRTLRYSNSLGTQFEVSLPQGAIWHGGSGVLQDGRVFFPNIPTEEIYTSPHRMSANGIVHAALPLSLRGNLVEDFWLRFEDGKVVETGARNGKEMLDGIIATDEGAARLGEVALVPYSSPIRQTGILFYSTLYDENASCHLALGKSFPECVEDGLQQDQQQLVERGLNDSAIHVDFMVGTSDLLVAATTADGRDVPIFEDGEWAL